MQKIAADKVNIMKCHPESTPVTINPSRSKGGFPVMAENTCNHIFSKEISQVIIAAMVLAQNFC